MYPYCACMYVCACMCLCTSKCSHGVVLLALHLCICVCMYECIYVCVYLCMYICMYVCVYVYVCTYVYVCVCVCLCIRVCMGMYVHLCISVCMCVCMYVCMCYISLHSTHLSSSLLPLFSLRYFPCSPSLLFSQVNRMCKISLSWFSDYTSGPREIKVWVRLNQVCMGRVLSESPDASKQA